MLSAGWSPLKVAIFQLISASTAFIGLYVGISVSESSDAATEWILAAAAGLFLYIALADVVRIRGRSIKSGVVAQWQRTGFVTGRSPVRIPSRALRVTALLPGNLHTVALGRLSLTIAPRVGTNEEQYICRQHDSARHSELFC